MAVVKILAFADKYVKPDAEDVLTATMNVTNSQLTLNADAETNTTAGTDDETITIIDASGSNNNNKEEDEEDEEDE